MIGHGIGRKNTSTRFSEGRRGFLLLLLQLFTLLLSPCGALANRAGLESFWGLGFNLYMSRYDGSLGRFVLTRGRGIRTLSFSESSSGCRRICSLRLAGVIFSGGVLAFFVRARHFRFNAGCLLIAVLLESMGRLPGLVDGGIDGVGRKGDVSCAGKWGILIGLIARVSGLVDGCGVDGTGEGSSVVRCLGMWFHLIMSASTCPTCVANCIANM